MGKRKESGYRAGSQVLRIPSAHGNRSLFLLSTFITLLLFLVGRGRDIPSSHRGDFMVFFYYFCQCLYCLCWGERAGEFLLRTVTALFFTCLFLLHYYYFYVGRGRGIRQTLLSATLCFLPRVYKYHRMQEEPHSLRRRNSSDLSLRHALLPAESLQLL